MVECAAKRLCVNPVRGPEDTTNKSSLKQFLQQVIAFEVVSVNISNRFIGVHLSRLNNANFGFQFVQPLFNFIHSVWSEPFSDNG